MILWRNINFFHFLSFLIPTPDFPHFHYMLGGNLGSLLYEDVSLMKTANQLAQVDLLLCCLQVANRFLHDLASMCFDLIVIVLDSKK